MTGWRAVRKIAGFNWRRERFGLAFMLLFVIYVGWLVGMLLGDWLIGSRIAQSISISTDWMYLLVFPAFGQCMNRTSFRIMREDSYSRQLAYWRTMPIPLTSIIQARLLRSVICILAFGVLFGFLQYGISSELRVLLGPGEWLAFTWIWICYGLAMNALLLWLEMGLSGKRYMWIYWGVMVFSGLVAAGLSTQGVSLVGGTIDWVASGHYGWLPVFTLLAVVVLIAGYRLTLNRMRLRSYYF